jgi:hypothetical protein
LAATATNPPDTIEPYRFNQFQVRSAASRYPLFINSTGFQFLQRVPERIGMLDKFSTVVVASNNGWKYLWPIEKTIRP